MPSPCQILIFAKAPRPGFTKTRLAERLGPLGACEAYRLMVAALLHRIQSLPQVEIRFTPEDALPEIEPWLQPDWRARPQGSGTLGDRLLRAFEETLEVSPGPVLVIGSDCPWIGPEDLQRAAQLLESGQADVVLGPASDGGYWLVGARNPHPTLFQNIEWSTPRVLEQTLQASRDAGLRVQCLRELDDIDTLAEWEAFLAYRAGASTFSPSIE